MSDVHTLVLVSCFQRFAMDRTYASLDHTNTVLTLALIRQTAVSSFILILILAVCQQTLVNSLIILSVNKQNSFLFSCFINLTMNEDMMMTNFDVMITH